GVDHHALAVNVEHDQRDAVAISILGVKLVTRRHVGRKFFSGNLQYLLQVALAECLLRRESHTFADPWKHARQRELQLGNQLPVAEQKGESLATRVLYEFPLFVEKLIGKVRNGVGTDLKGLV